MLHGLCSMLHLRNSPCRYGTLGPRRFSASNMHFALRERYLDSMFLEQPPHPVEHVRAHTADATLGVADPGENLMLDTALAECGEPDIRLGAIEHARAFGRGPQHQFLRELQVATI